MKKIKENITNIGALKAFIDDLPDDLEIDVDSVGKLDLYVDLSQ